MAVPADQLAAAEMLRTLPGDDVRQIMWRISDRYDLQMLVQSAREVARGPVARIVAEGGRNSHDWTEKKNELLKHYDECGITGVHGAEQGGFIEGPKNLALALAAFELAWVDARRRDRRPRRASSASRPSTRRHAGAAATAT